jgi:1,4-alpha-glucan branching enzyme/maltooligosyltrehalose trehalohydrolase
MPFGAELRDDGRVHFRLWAPAAERVDVCLSNGNADSGSETGSTQLPMNAGAGGWFELATDRASAGTRYRFRIDGDRLVPDPASRYQPDDVHGPSEVIDPCDWQWRDAGWRGRDWEEAIIYELHVGSFTPQGNFAAVQEKLDYLVELGITAIELMPVADFPGRRNWGYDGTCLFAPDSQYGRPEDLKALVDTAHARGLMVFLDVVYNHFGPEGNYLHVYAPQFFTKRHRTPWGAAIDFDGEHSEITRQFFIHNALYWLEEYHLDGLRLDAVNEIRDESSHDLLTELAQCVRDHFDQTRDNLRRIHLVLENDHNASRYLERDSAAKPHLYAAQWNDDIHHALHVLLTGESGGYYLDYVDKPIQHLIRCMNEGFAYQGERSRYRNNQPRGEASGHLPPTAFVSFLQNHDQVGNRAFGERINSLARPEQLHATLALLLLAPSPPLLFMGEEWGCTQPFMFFCDFGPDFADKVVAGRRRDLSRYLRFGEHRSRRRIPSPMDDRIFEQTVLDWNACNLPEHKQMLELYRELLALRRRELIPRFRNITGQQNDCTRLSIRAFTKRWVLGGDSELVLMTNLGDDALTGIEFPPGRILYTTHTEALMQHDNDHLPPWSVIWYMNAA